MKTKRMLIAETAVKIAEDDTHGYSQVNRNGNPDFDCSSLVIYCAERAGIPVKKYGATYTGNIYQAFKKAGFVDVTNEVDVSSGAGLEAGDILLNPHKHVEIYSGNGYRVGARHDENKGVKGMQKGDQTGNEISIKKYTGGWKKILRYKG